MGGFARLVPVAAGTERRRVGFTTRGPMLGLDDTGRSTVNACAIHTGFTLERRSSSNNMGRVLPSGDRMMNRRQARRTTLTMAFAAALRGDDRTDVGHKP